MNDSPTRPAHLAGAPLTPVQLALLDYYGALDEGDQPPTFPIRAQLVHRTRTALVAHGLVVADAPHGARRLTDEGSALLLRRAAVVERLNAVAERLRGGAPADGEGQ